MPGWSLLLRGETLTQITLNGIYANVKSGLTILEAAAETGVRIPALCHYEGHENGTCRLCLVEVKGIPKKVPSCSTIIKDGMQITTETENIREYRKSLLAMLDHGNHDGEKEAKYRLHEYATEYGIVSLASNKLESRIDRSHPGIEFDPSLCIKCGKCLIACNEEQGNDVIGFHSRGQDLEIEFDDGLLLGQSSCKSCGSCVDACPTGALIEKNWVKADRTVTTICPYFAVGCTIEYGVRGNRIVWARGLEGIGVNEGKLCMKGKFGWQFNSSQERLRTPLIRKAGTAISSLGNKSIENVFREASWAEALELISDRLNSVKQSRGADSIGGIACDRGTNEDIYAFQKFMRVVIGNDNIDQSATLCHAPSAAMLSYATGTGSGTNPIHDVKNSRTIMVIGSNTDRAHPVISAYIKKAKRNGAILIVIDPRRVDLAEKADIFLQI
jgi:formate dehydrogenase major subunit